MLNYWTTPVATSETGQETESYMFRFISFKRLMFKKLKKIDNLVAGVSDV
jgi:hypothetical protein